MRSQPIEPADLPGHRGLRRSAIAALVAAQPETVLDALRHRRVGRQTTRVLLDAGPLTDAEGVQRRSVYDVIDREALGSWKVE